MITLSDGTTTVSLHRDYLWLDEHDWYPVEQAVDRGLTGSLIVQVSSRLAGRPITLQPEDASASWTSSAVLAQLQAWAALPGRQLSLIIRGETRQVIFRHQDGPIGATPVTHHGSDLPHEPGDWFLVTIRLMEV